MTEASENTGKRRSAEAEVLAEFWFYFSENRGAVIGLFVFVALVLIAIFAPLVAPHEPTHQYRDALLQPPVWAEGGTATYLLGTDAVGRDILSRLIYGARFSLFIGVVVVSLSLSIGITLGLLAGFVGGKLDTLIMRVMDVILSFPSLLLALVLVAILGPGLMNAMIAIALILQPHFVRLTRAAVLSEKNRDYVTAARGRRSRSVPAHVPHHPAQLHGPADRPGNAVVFQCHTRRRRPRVSRAWGRSPRRPNGAPCWRRRASSSCARPGW